MGIEQRLDLLTPLNAMIAKLADSLKTALSGEANVKINLETTPLQEVEASIQRTKENAPESASSKLSGADPFSKASGSAQDEFERAEKRIEAIAGRIGYLLQKIEGGKDATGNAAQEVERLKDALEKVAQKGREAAKSMGDQGLAESITKAEEAAGQGRGGNPLAPGGGGRGAGIGDLMSMIRNPQGAMMNAGGTMAESALTDAGMLAGGKLIGAGGAAIGLTAAIVAGVYGAIKLHDSLAKDATSDAYKIVADGSLSRSTGSRFDLRGSTFDENRWAPRTYTQDQQYMSSQEVRSAIRGMGVGLDNWTSVFSAVDPRDSAVNSAMEMSRYAYSMGVSTDQVGGMVGAGIRSGAVSPNDLKVHQYLSQIAGATEEAAKYGISSNEKLQVIASLNQKTVAETGWLSPMASKLNLQASSALEASGDRILGGASGMNALDIMAGNGSDAARSREISFMLDGSGNLLPEYQAMVEKDPILKMKLADLGPVAAANALLDNKRLRAGVVQRGMRNIVGSGGGKNVGLASRWFGMDGSESQTGLGAYAALESEDILSKSVPTQTDPLHGDSTMMKEFSENLKTMWSGQNRDDVKKTGYDAETARNLNEAAKNLNAAANHIGRTISQPRSENGGRDLDKDFYLLRGIF